MEERRQERGFWKGVVWLEADDLFVTTSKTPKSPCQPQAELSPQSRTRGSGLPTERPGEFLLPPPPRTGAQEVPRQPCFTTSSVSTLTTSPLLVAVLSPGAREGAPGDRTAGFRLVSITLLGPHWSASPRGLLDTASACRSVGTPGKLLGDPLSLQCTCVLGTRSTTSG